MIAGHFSWRILDPPENPRQYQDLRVQCVCRYICFRKVLHVALGEGSQLQFGERARGHIPVSPMSTSIQATQHSRNASEEESHGSEFPTQNSHWIYQHQESRNGWSRDSTIQMQIVRFETALAENTWRSCENPSEK